LLVRVNPLYPGSKTEIDKVIENGADIVMLPFFKTKEEVVQFLAYVENRVEVCLLVETPEAVQEIDSILSVPGIDYVYIGLNDLHLGYGMKFMFEPLANGMVELLSVKIKKKGVPFGFGGIARIGEGILPAECVIAEHYRLGSSMVILSRTFCNVDKTPSLEEISRIFASGIADVRTYEVHLKDKPQIFFEENHVILQKTVAKIVKAKL